MRWRERFYEPETWLVVMALGIGILLVAFWRAIQPEHRLVTAPDGQLAWLIECSTPGDCVTESARACPAGWNQLSHAERHGTVTTIANVSVGDGQSVGIPSTSSTYEGASLIRCRP